MDAPYEEIARDGNFWRGNSHVSNTTDINEPDRDTLLEQARALPSSVEPPGDLWPAIRARAAQTQSRAHWPQARYAVAALVLICITSGVSFWLGRVGAPAPSAAITTQSMTVHFGRHHTLGSEFVRARSDLNVALELELVRMTPETRSVVVTNLATLEEALSQINVALTGNPNNVMLQRMLLSAYTEELFFLREVNGLARSVREGTEI